MGENDKLKVGMVGVGGFGGARRKKMRKTGLFDIKAAYDVNEDALAKCQQEDGAQPVNSYEELLDTPGLEAMIISTGGKFHAEQTEAALDRGLHCFVEKPYVSTPEELQKVLEVEKRNDLVVGSGHNDHSSDAKSLHIKNMIDSEEIGQVASFEATAAHSGGFKIKEGDWRGDPERNPGGMLFQCGVHKFHQLMYYFGPVKQISARMRYDVHTTQTADTAFCHVEFESGMIGSLNAYHVTPSRATIFIFGTRTAIYENDHPWGAGGIWTQSVPEALDGSAEPVVPLDIEGESDDTGNIKSFYNAVKKGTPCYPSGMDGARAVACVFAAEESAKTGRIVEVQSYLG